MKKKLILLVLSLVMVLGLIAGCGSKTDQEPEKETDKAEEVVEEDVETDDEDTDAEAPAEDDEADDAEPSDDALSIVIVSSPSGVDDGNFNQDNYIGIQNFIKNYPNATVEDIEKLLLKTRLIQPLV